MAVLSDITVVMSIGTLVLLWAMQEGPATVPLWAQRLTHACTVGRQLSFNPIEK